MDIPTPPSEPVFSAGGHEKVIAAIVEVTKRVQNIPKLGKNLKDKYEYVRWADLAARLQDALAHAELVFSQRQISRGVQNKVLMIGYTFDALHASGQYVLNITSATGSCRFEFLSGVTDDKSPGKAHTAAMKSAVLSLFKISADADQDIERDSFDPDDRRPRGDVREDPPREAYREAYREPPRDPPPREPPREPPRDYPPGDPGRDYPPRDEEPRRSSGPPLDRPPVDRDPPMDRMEREYERGDITHAPDRGPPTRDDELVTPRVPEGVPAPIPTEESELRRRVTMFNNDIIRAATEEDAAGLWVFEARMLRVLSDVTYDFLYKNYQARWPHDPPKPPR